MTNIVRAFSNKSGIRRTLPANCLKWTRFEAYRRNCAAVPCCGINEIEVEFRNVETALDFVPSKICQLMDIISRRHHRPFQNQMNGLWKTKKSSRIYLVGLLFDHILNLIDGLLPQALEHRFLFRLN